MYSRHSTTRLLEALEDTPAVLLAGGRQTGKTTLAKAVARSAHPARYVTLDDPTVLAAARADPAGFLSDLDVPVVLDEIQQVPALFPVLRGAIDRDRAPGRFLLTGSAQVLMTPRLAEALVGRMEVLNLWPLSQGELEDVREGFVDAVFGTSLPHSRGSRASRDDLWERALAGGFPEARRRSAARRRAWIAAYLDLLLQRDVQDLAAIEQLELLPRLLEHVAARVGSLLNFAELSRSAGLPQTTLKRYFALLEGVFLVVRIPAWTRSHSKRMTKSPKLYLCDTALLGHLGRLSPGRLREQPVLGGPLIENLAAVELSKQLGWSGRARQLLHFRTAAGQQVDFVLEDDRGRLVGVEVKSAATVTAGDFRGLDALAEVAGSAFHRGIVLYAGAERVAFGRERYALPFHALWTLAAAPARGELPARD